MSAKVLPIGGRREETDITGLVFHLADINGEAWAHLSQARLAQIENIARLALSAMKGGDRG